MENFDQLIAEFKYSTIPHKTKQEIHTDRSSFLNPPPVSFVATRGENKYVPTPRDNKKKKTDSNIEFIIICLYHHLERSPNILLDL